MKQNIIYIIEGVSKSKGGDSKSFLGAASNREQAFNVCLEHSKRELFETFNIFQYNVNTNKYIGSSEIVFPYQEYTDDGHLIPKSKRVDGKCLQGFWGPYCAECRKTFNLELSKNLSPEKIKKALKSKKINLTLPKK